MSDADNPCVRCGACCATFRVSFYWTEAADVLGGKVPVALTERVGTHLRCMRGTNQATPRCVALAGEIGGDVRCTIYEQRSSTCRDVLPGDEQCAKARRKWGMEPLPLVPGIPDVARD